jgi:hypothetical protein
MSFFELVTDPATSEKAPIAVRFDILFAFACIEQLSSTERAPLPRPRSGQRTVYGCGPCSGGRA